MRYANSRCVRVFNEDYTITYTGKCIVTGKEVKVTVPARGVARYNGGANIQNAFPNTPEHDREFLMSGISKEGWDLRFGDTGE